MIKRFLPCVDKAHALSTHETMLETLREQKNKDKKRRYNIFFLSLYEGDS